LDDLNPVESEIVTGKVEPIVGEKRKTLNAPSPIDDGRFLPAAGQTPPARFYPATLTDHLTRINVVRGFRPLPGFSPIVSNGCLSSIPNSRLARSEDRYALGDR